MHRSFPCPYCKGKGEYPELGTSYLCNMCDGTGEIIIGSSKHRDLKRYKADLRKQYKRHLKMLNEMSLELYGVGHPWTPSKRP